MAEYDSDENEEPDTEDFMSEAREKFVQSRDAIKDAVENAKNDILFGVLGEQWEQSDVDERRRKGRPCLTINKFPAYIRQVVNDSRQNRPRIRFRPVDDNADPQTAEVLNGLIRNIEVSSKADIAYDSAIFQSVAGGFGYLRVNLDYAYDDTFEQDIKIERIENQFSVYPDPKAKSADGSDWNCCFITDRITRKEFQKKYPGKQFTDFETEDAVHEWENDDGIWIAEYWKREEVEREICLLSDGSVVDEDVYEENLELYETQGVTKLETRTTKSYKVTQYIISGAEILEENEWVGKYIPIVPVYGEEIWLEGERSFKSLIRDSKDPQRMLNYWRSTSTELVGGTSKAPYLGEEGSFIDPEKWATSNVNNYSYLEYKKGAPPPQKQQFAGVPVGVIQEGINASDDLQATMGMFGASIGMQDNAISGRAINARKLESDTGTFHFIDNLSRSLAHVGCIILDLIPHVYQPGRIIRVLGEDMRETQNVQLAQEGQQPDYSNIFDLTLGRYDVTVDVGPGYTTRRQEAAEQMIEFARVNPQAAGLISDLIAKNLDWPGAQEISDRFKAVLPPQITGEDPQIQQLQQMLQQTQQQAQQAMQQLQQQIEQLKTDKAIDAEKVKIDAYNAETNRLKTMQAGLTPEQVQMLVVQTVQQLMQSPDILPPEQISPVMANPGVN